MLAARVLSVARSPCESLRASSRARPPRTSHIPQEMSLLVGSRLAAAVIFALSHSASCFSTATPRKTPFAPHSWSVLSTTSSRLFSTTETAPLTSGEIMKPTEKLDALRSKMKESDLDVYLVLSDDPHLSEYVPAAYMRRAFLSNFKGSAGTAVITADKALLWTDSRYWNEAGGALDPNVWELQKQGLPTTPIISKWLAEKATEHYKETQQPLNIGLDPMCVAASFAKDVEDALKEAAELEFNNEDLIIGVIDSSHDNLVDPIWGEDRPPVPTSPFTVHPLEYAGVSIADKVAKIRDEMKTKKASMSVFCTLDDVAYLLNVRCQGDVETCPVGIAYAIVTDDNVCVYCDERKLVSDEVKEHLKEVTIKSYDSVVGDIATHCAESSSHKVWVDTTRANYAIVNTIPKKQLVNSQNAIVPMKACKNEAELEGMRKAHIVDGAAMAKFMVWLETTILQEGRAVSEVEIDEVLTGYRAEQEGFKEPSFPTIAGVGPNGAIVHYRAAPNTELLKYLDTSNPILIDSGGQYTYGTTDVTRTWHLGKATDEFKEYYTRVLKGNIGLDSMIFPENTPGFALDIYARQHLFEIGKDYGHGTGHGVGAALNVHEGPMSISPRWANKEGLKAGMVLSNEPGYYEDGRFGIRIENLLEIQCVSDEEAAPGHKRFLKFSKLTMIPIQKNLIKTELMTPVELDWLDDYHQQVFAKVSPLLEQGTPEYEWLERSCAKMERS